MLCMIYYMTPPNSIILHKMPVCHKTLITFYHLKTTIWESPLSWPYVFCSCFSSHLLRQSVNLQQEIRIQEWSQGEAQIHVFFSFNLCLWKNLVTQQTQSQASWGKKMYLFKTCPEFISDLKCRLIAMD